MAGVSVIIPVKNGAATIQRCLNSIFTQTISTQIEVIIIDSGSTDNTLEIVKNFDIKLYSIHPDLFNHGLTRNLGFSYASANFLYYTVQDAYLSADDTLERMLQHFNDESISAVCGNQGVPHEQDKNPVSWYMPVSKAGIKRLYFSSPELFDELEPSKKIEVCGWDNVNAMYRKSALQKIPFEKCEFGEDLIWCKAALRHGFTLLMDTAIITLHYHFADYQYQLKVNIVSGYVRYREFGFVPDYPSVLSRIKFITVKLIKLSAVSFKKKAYWFIHNHIILIADIKSIWLLKKAVAAGGVRTVSKLYHEKCDRQLMGRLKGQQQQ